MTTKDSWDQSLFLNDDNLHTPQVTHISLEGHYMLLYTYLYIYCACIPILIVSVELCTYSVFMCIYNCRINRTILQYSISVYIIFLIVFNHTCFACCIVVYIYEIYDYSRLDLTYPHTSVLDEIADKQRYRPGTGCNATHDEGAVVDSV